MDDDDVLDLGCQVLPWISNQVILIGQHTRNKVYGTLGCELFVLSQQIASISGTAIALQKLLKVFEIVDKACSVGVIVSINQPVFTNTLHRGRGMRRIDFKL